MAAREHKVSRRVLLGAACALPVLSAVEGPLIPPVLSPSKGHPGLDPGSIFSLPPQKGRGIPDQARNDEGEGQSFVVTNWDRALTRYRQAEAALAAVDGADEALFDRLVGRLNRTLARLFRTPAPNLPALATKLDLLIAHQVWELRYAEASMTALKRDAHRLARSPR